MTGFEPRTSGVGSDRSANWATTTAKVQKMLSLHQRVVCLSSIHQTFFNQKIKRNWLCCSKDTHRHYYFTIITKLTTTTQVITKLTTTTQVITRSLATLFKLCHVEKMKKAIRTGLGHLSKWVKVNCWTRIACKIRLHERWFVFKNIIYL